MLTSNKRPLSFTIFEALPENSRKGFPFSLCKSETSFKLNPEIPVPNAFENASFAQNAAAMCSVLLFLLINSSCSFIENTRSKKRSLLLIKESIRLISTVF